MNGLENIDIGFIAGRPVSDYPTDGGYDPGRDAGPGDINPATMMEAAFADVSARFDRDPEFSLTEAIRAMERIILVRTLVAVGGNKKRASRILGLKYTTLFEKLRVHRIQMKRVSRGPTCWEIDIQ